MSRALFVSDLHASLRLPLAKLDPGGVSSDRLRDVVSVLGQVQAAAVDQRASFVAILGDLFDQQHPDGATLVATSRALGAMAREVPTYVLPGNHDAVDRDGRLYSLQFYRELDVHGLHVLGHETAEPVDGVLLHAVPWLPEERARKRIRARSKGLPTGARNLLLFHQGIRGALWDSGRASSDGLEADIGDGFDLALTGHYHRPQEFPSGRFLGAPLDLRFGDEEVVARGAWAVDLDTLAAELVPTTYPHFQTLHVRYLEGDVDLGDAGSPAERLEEGVQYLRIVIEGKASEIRRDRKLIDSWSTSAAAWGLRAVRLDIRPGEERRERMENTSGLSLSELTRLYARERAPEGVDPEELAAFGARLLDEGAP